MFKTFKNKGLQKLCSCVLVFLFYGGISVYSSERETNELSVPVAENPFIWGEFDIPAPPFSIVGAFAAVYENHIVLAGGYNSDLNEYSDIIQVVDLNIGQWSVLEIKLDQKTGFGSCVVADGGIFMLGGLTSEGVSSKVLKIYYDGSNNEWKKETMPDIPVPVAFAGSCVFGNRIFIAGGINETVNEYSSDFYEYDYSNRQWRLLGSLPQDAISKPALKVQSDGEINLIYVLIERESDQKGSYSFFSYNPINQVWIQRESPPAGLANPVGITKGGFHILYLSKRGNNLFDIEENDKVLPKPEGLLYHTITNRWTALDKSDVPVPIILFQSNIDIFIGTEFDGRMAFYFARPSYDAIGLRYFDVFTFVVYIIVLLYIGYWFSRRSDDTDGYFRGGRRVPAWAAGVSIIGTKLSAVTFMSIPAKVFATDWLYILIPINGIALAYFVVKVIIPFWHRLDVTSAYEYLEKRFDVVVRIMGSTTYIFWELGRMGIMLLLPSIVIAIVLGIDIYLCIALIGLVAVLYTLMGGIEAVVWSDVLQVAVMLGGIILALFIMVYKTDGSIPELVRSAYEQKKLKAFDFSFDWTTATVWVIMLGWIGRIQEYVSMQAVVQRFLTVKDEKAAGRSMWIAVIVIIPILIFFYMVGTGLFLYYQEFPQKLSTNITQLDSMLPYFIITQLPSGISGLVIAGIFAAAMSSLDSAVHSMSTVITTDYYKRFALNFNEKTAFRLAKYLVVILGVLGTGSAMLMAGLPIQSLFDQLMLVTGLFGGGLAGIFLIGMLTKRAHSIGVIAGFLLSGFIQYYISIHTNIHFLLYAVTGLFSCFLIGYVLSVLIPKRSSLNINKYTIYGLNDYKKFNE